MHLFTRTRTADPEHFQDALAFSVEIAEYVSEVADIEVIPWMSLYGAPVGTITFSARVDSLARMGVAQETLTADTGYLERVTTTAARVFTGPAEDSIAQFIDMAGTANNTGHFASVVTAQCAGGKIAEAMTWGVDIMNLASKVGGTDIALVRGLYGPWATLGWISVVETLAAIDEFEAQTAADPSYVEALDRGGDLFVPGSGLQRLFRRLA